MNPEQCVILVPVAAHIEPATLDCLSRLMDRGYRVQTLRGCSQIDLARSMLATDALRDGFAETLWIDSDVTFTVEDVERLRAHGKPFTAGLYVKKGNPEFACKFREGTRELTFGTDGGLIELEYAAMGFTHIRREVYERIQSGLGLPTCSGGYDGKTIVPYFLPLLAPIPGGFDYLSEDYSFCYRARQVACPVFADTRLKLGHGNGPYRYTWDDIAPRQTFAGGSIEIEQKQRPVPSVVTSV